MPKTVAAHALPPSRAEGFDRVTRWLAERGHAQAPVWLEVAARTSQEAAVLLGVALGQIAKSVVFRRQSDDQAVLVIASGDRRVDERELETCGAGRPRGCILCEGAHRFCHWWRVTGRAAGAPFMLIDRELQRFDRIWAAAGHPNGVFCLSPADLSALTGAPWADVVQA